MLSRKMESINDLSPEMQARIRVNEKTGCWEWIGSRGSKGYGNLRWKGRMVSAHRLMRHLFVGDISISSKNMSLDTIDHLCEVRHCVNPAHCEPTTMLENARRSWSTYTPVTHCPQGHPYEGDNLYIDSTGGRRCRECGRRNDHRAYLKKKAGDR